jgi:hypothetical protein
MSHFLTLVFVIREEAVIGRRVRELMGPYFAAEDVYSSGEPQGRYANCVVVAVDCHC